jgi:hypothetical protein
LIEHVGWYTAVLAEMLHFNATEPAKPFSELTVILFVLPVVAPERNVIEGDVAVRLKMSVAALIKFATSSEPRPVDWS